MMSNLTVLDCTFRDGGYYNKWDFNRTLVDDYVSVTAKAGIKVLELGLRNFPKNQFLGAFAYTADEYIRGLNIDKDILVGVMIDAKAILSSGYSIEKAISLLFKPCNESPVGLVRIAVHFTEVEESQLIATELSSIGYIVGFNLMQSGGQPCDELTEKASLIQRWNTVDVLYFADSLGNMDVPEVGRIVKALRAGWDGELGIHTHNNKGQAIQNTFAAIKCGVTWLDATLTGMGRGAGNAQTEILLLELNKQLECNYKPDELFGLILNDFMPMQKELGWGTNLLYHLAADNNIHPTFVQEILADNRYSIDEILQTFNFIKLNGARSYSPELLELAKTGMSTEQKGTWDARGWCDGQEVLVLGAGPEILEHRESIIQYINTHSPKVIALNSHQNIPEEFIDLYVASNDTRFLIESGQYSNLKKMVALPLARLKNALGEVSLDCNLLDYGLNVQQATFKIDKTDCTLPSPLAAGYAFSIATAGGGTKLMLAGFDGYPVDDSRQLEMIELITLYKKHTGALPLIALTSTSYPVTKSSIYAPRI